MSAAAPLPTLLALTAYLVFLVVQRLFELALSARHQRALAVRGGYEVGASHFWVFVVLHSLYPIALAVEVLGFGALPDGRWPLWLALWIGAQALRAAAHRALRDRWTVRIWVVPGLAPVSGGIYRWLRHPNYVAVTLELVAGAMLFGARRTAIAASALNLAAMLIRIPAEEQALAKAASPR